MTQTSSATSSRAELLGPAFAHAVARRDFAQVAELLCPDVEFRAVTPRRFWEADTAEETLRILATWFNPNRVVDEVLALSTDLIGDRQSVTYRFAGEEEQRGFAIEQHAYYTARDDRIGWMRLVCSGFRPYDAA
jgi:hypothetical protein